jgi:hypothetical protein
VESPQWIEKSRQAKALIPADFSIDSSLYPLLCLMLIMHFGIGIGAAMVARRKGFNFQLWLIWGLIGGTVALVGAVLADRKV